MLCSCVVHPCPTRSHFQNEESLGYSLLMSKKYTCLIIVFLTLACCITFGRIAGNEFICFDDGRYIIGNNHVQSGFNAENVQWALTAVVSGNWHPLTMLSHMLDWTLFGAHPAGHHIVSLMLHIGAVVSISQ